MVAGGEAIGEQDEIILEAVTGFARKLEAIGVGKRNTEKLGLRSLISALVGIPVGSTCRARIRSEASGRMAVDAHCAEATADVSGNSDAATLLDAHDARTDFFDDAERLMADDAAFDAAHAAFVKM